MELVLVYRPSLFDEVFMECMRISNIPWYCYLVLGLKMQSKYYDGNIFIFNIKNTTLFSEFIKRYGKKNELEDDKFIDKLYELSDKIVSFYAIKEEGNGTVIDIDSVYFSDFNTGIGLELIHNRTEEMWCIGEVTLYMKKLRISGLRRAGCKIFNAPLFSDLMYEYPFSEIMKKDKISLFNKLKEFKTLDDFVIFILDTFDEAREFYESCLKEGLLIWKKYKV